MATNKSTASITGTQTDKQSSVQPGMRMLDYGRGLIREDQLLAVEKLNNVTNHGFEFVVSLVGDRRIYLYREEAENLYYQITGKRYTCETKKEEECET